MTTQIKEITCLKYNDPIRAGKCSISLSVRPGQSSRQNAQKSTSKSTSDYIPILTLYFTMILILKMAEKTRQSLLEMFLNMVHKIPIPNLKRKKLLPIIGPEYKPMGLSPQKKDRTSSACFVFDVVTVCSESCAVHLTTILYLCCVSLRYVLNECMFAGFR